MPAPARLARTLVLLGEARSRGLASRWPVLRGLRPRAASRGETRSPDVAAQCRRNPATRWVEEPTRCAGRGRGGWLADRLDAEGAALDMVLALARLAGSPAGADPLPARRPQFYFNLNGVVQPGDDGGRAQAGRWWRVSRAYVGTPPLPMLGQHQTYKRRSASAPPAWGIFDDAVRAARRGSKRGR